MNKFISCVPRSFSPRNSCILQLNQVNFGLIHLGLDATPNISNPFASLVCRHAKQFLSISNNNP